MMFARMLLLGVVSCLVIGGQAFGQTVSEMMRFIPADANSIVIFRVHDFIHGPRGIAEGWPAKHQEAYLNGGVSIPPWVKLFVSSSHIHPGSLGGDWTAAFVPLPSEFEIQKLAEREQSEVQEIAGHASVFVDRRNGYFVEFKEEGNENRFLAGMAPATRQVVAKWVSEIDAAPTARVSPYLLDLAQKEDSLIVLAVDLNEMLDPKQIRYRLSGSETLKDLSKERIELTIDLQSLQGICLLVNVQSSATSRIRFDFKRNIGNEGEHLKDILIEYLNDAGAGLEDIEQAKVSIAGKSVTLEFQLSDEGLQRVLSLATAVAPSSAAGKTVAPPEPGVAVSSRGVTSEINSLRYFKAVNQNVAGMEKAYRKITNYRQTAQWHDNFARRIDELPIEGVDPALVEYGHRMSSLLRSLGASLRGMGVKVDGLNQQIEYKVEQKPIYYSGADWWWGGARTVYGAYNYGRPMETKVETNLQEVRARQTEIVTNSQPERDQIWQTINDQRSTIKGLMVQKYGAAFDIP